MLNVLPPLKRSAVFAQIDRLVRFGSVGGACGMLQLALLAGLLRVGMLPPAGNVVAYLVSAQLNFVLSSVFIWPDRGLDASLWRSKAGRWVSFHGSIGAGFLLSQAIFLVARMGLPNLAAAALGLGCSGIASFVMQDRFTFARAKSQSQG
jgi:putative flippase GtrA